jgi:hypothetical protein
VDMQDLPLMPYNPGSGLLGLLTRGGYDQRWLAANRQIGEENTQRRQMARANQPSYCPPDVPRRAQAPSPQFGHLGGTSAPPITEGEEVFPGSNFGAGQTVYSQRECIGAVVNDQCFGSILPDYSRPHPTCYGQMLNGSCIGAIF